MLSDNLDKILIIDEDGAFGDDLTALLVAMGMETKIVCDATEGISMLRDGLYDIVIVDPVEHISTLEEISEHIPDVVVIATTRVDAIGSSARALKAGAIDLLPASELEPGQFETVIRRAVDRKNMLRETVRLKKRIVRLYVVAGLCFIGGFLIFFLRW
ncbi:MAG: response regulator [Deltaproteobacteria bacterium]|nr:response regulator [Deltaproteobacteria bacterium]